MIGQTLNGAVAVVTGARGDIGRAICAALAGAGARVVASGVGAAPKDLEYAAWFHQDVTSADDWSQLIRDIERQFGRLDCLVNNAGISLVERISNTSIDQWRNVFRVNVESILVGLQASLSLLRESGVSRIGGSSVINISSVAGLRGVAFGAAYSASKAAVTLLSKSAAKEFGALGYPIRVNSVHPGAVDTRMMDDILLRYVERGFAPSVDFQRTAFHSLAPLARMAMPGEIAGAVAFLCSPESSFMTGAELVIDGGVSA